MRGYERVQKLGCHAAGADHRYTDAVAGVYESVCAVCVSVCVEEKGGRR